MKEDKMKRILSIMALVVFCMLVGGMVFAAGQKEAAKGAQKELQVVAVLYGQANEGTWEPAAYTALQKVQKEIPFTLQLAESTSTQDAEKVIRNWAARGVDILFAHSLIYMDQVISVAKQFPKVHFICEAMLNPDENLSDPEYLKQSSSKTPANMTVVGDTPYEGNFMAGYVAGMMTKSKKIGILEPFESPGLNRYSNCFYYGVKASNPDVAVSIVYLGDYIAPAETRDAVKSFAQKGIDIVFSEMDDNSAILECQAQGIYCVPMYMDKAEVAPATVLTSVVFDWSKLLKGSMEAVAKGTMAEYRKANYFRGLTVKDDSIYLGKFAATVPQNVKDAATKIKNQLKDGSLKFPLVTDVIIK
jgi:basic membrane protein A and related proteins